MTPMQIKIALYGGLALLALWCTRKALAGAVSGGVELGVGTVDHIYGNDIYYSARPSSLPAPSTNPVGPVDEAIERSRRILDADRAENPDLWSDQ